MSENVARAPAEPSPATPSEPDDAERAAEGEASRAGGRSTVRTRARRGKGRSRDSSDRTAVLVLGMHRSGTSALTRTLGLCGAGLPAHLMPASEDNPRGYFESQPVYQLHEELFQATGRAWDDLTAPSTGWQGSPAAQPWADRAAEVLEKEFDGPGPFVLKDPRMCRLLPLWRRALRQAGTHPACVLVVRNPLDVAASLGRAHGTGPRHALLLWLHHFLLAERDTRDLPRTFVRYEDLLADWRGVVGRIARDLGLSLPGSGRRAGAEIDAFLTSSLRHHAASPAEAFEDEGGLDWVKRVYRQGLRAAGGRAPSARVLDRTLREFEAAESVFGPLLASAEHQRSRATADALSLASGLRTARGELDDRTKEVEQLRSELDGARRDATLRRRDLEAAHRAAEARARELESAHHEAQARAGEIRALQAERHDVERRLASDAEEHRRQVEALRGELASAGEGLAASRREAAQLRERLDAADRELASEHERAEDTTRQLLRAQGFLSTRESELGELRQQLEAIRAEVERLKGQRTELQQKLSAKHVEIGRLGGQQNLTVLDLRKSQDEVRRLRAEIADRDLHVEQLSLQLERLENSLVWRVHPVRLARGAMRRLRRR